MTAIISSTKKIDLKIKNVCWFISYIDVKVGIYERSLLTCN